MTEETEVDHEIVEQLRASYQALGPLDKIVLDANGKIVDGKHRKVAIPNWPTEINPKLKTEEDCLNFMVAKNWNRTTKNDEWKKRIIKRYKELGNSVEQIRKKTGLGERTIYRYMPQELKKEEPPQLASAKVALNRESQDTATSLHQTANTENIPIRPNGLTTCEIGLHLVDPKRAKNIEGHIVCEAHEEIGKRRFAINKPVSEAKTPLKPPETWEFQKSRMKVSPSKMDEAMLIRLQNNKELRELGCKIEFQKAYTKVLCVSDVTVTLKNGKEIAFFWDFMETHKNRDLEDDANRMEAKFLHNIECHPIVYNAVTETEEARLEKEAVQKIKEA